MSIPNNYTHVREHHHDATRLTRRTLFSTLIPGAILTSDAFPQNTDSMAERFRKMSTDYERKGLADPFKGITANGTVESGFFGIHSTGVSTASVRTAAERFLASLSQQQRNRTMFAVDDPEWRKWDESALLCAPGRQFPGDDGLSA